MSCKLNAHGWAKRSEEDVLAEVNALLESIGL